MRVLFHLINEDGGLYDTVRRKNTVAQIKFKNLTCNQSIKLSLLLVVKVDQFSGGQFAVGSGAVGVQSGPVNIQFPSKKIHRFHIFLLC